MITTNRCTSLDPQPPSPMRPLPPSDRVYSFSSPTGTVFVCHWPFWLLHAPIPPQQISRTSFSPASSQSNAILHWFQQYKSPTRFLTIQITNPFPHPPRIQSSPLFHPIGLPHHSYLPQLFHLPDPIFAKKGKKSPKTNCGSTHYTGNVAEKESLGVGSLGRPY